MKPNSRFHAALAFAVLAACVIGCKSGGSSNTESSRSSTASDTGAASVPPPPAPNVAGKYNIVGTNPNGSVYRGTLAVIKQGDVYQFRWNAGTQYDGIGVQNGNIVAVAFASGANGKGCGVVDYVIKSDGTLDGRWGNWGVNNSGAEIATRTSGSGLEGDYEATGRNPDGKEYKVKLTVEPAGNLYRFVWSNDTDGVGIRRGDNIAVGIGGARCGFVTYEVGSDGTLDGIWGGYGTDQTGTEKATKH